MRVRTYVETESWCVYVLAHLCTCDMGEGEKREMPQREESNRETMRRVRENMTPSSHLLCDRRKCYTLEW